MTGLRVVHLDLGRTWRGGQQQACLLHRELTAQGVESLLLARPGGPLLERCRREGLRAEPLGGRRPWSPGALRSVLRAAAGGTVLHAHDGHGAALGALARGLRPGLRLVCHRRVSYPLGRNPFSRWKRARCDGWVAVSGEIGEILSRAGVPGDRVRVVHSALDGETFRAAAQGADLPSLRASLGIPAGAPVVGFCGAFSPQKGHEVLLEAAPAVLAARPDAVFLLPGEGELREVIRGAVEARGLDPSFRIPGFRADVAALTALFAVGCVPSVDGEGSSASIKEPMVLGIPVVASDLPGNLEVLGDAGLTFRNRDPADLAGGVLALLADDGQREEMGRRARARSEAFSVARMAEGVLGAYEAALGRRR